MKRIRTIMIVLLIGLIGLRGYLFYSDWSNGKEREVAEAIFQETVYKKTNKETSGTPLNRVRPPALPKSNAKILGKIEIDSLDLSYIILDDATKENLAISISKVTGPDINGEGNLVLAGHNMRNGSLFGKLKYLKLKDTVRIQDLQGIPEEYVIYKKETVEPSDLSPLQQNISDTPIVTLITCNSSGDKRIIFYARQKDS